MLTPEQYLEIERKAEFKHDYYQGEMVETHGQSFVHNQLVANLIRGLGDQLRKPQCQVLASLMRVLTPSGLYTYPDLVGVCGPRLADDHMDILLNPCLIIEVLSPSTEAYDRGRKFEHYQSIESLREYILVASDRVRADLYTRQSDGRWLLTSASRLEDSLTLQSVGCQLTIANVYDKADITASTSGSQP